MYTKQIVVIGAGVMGTAVALHLALFDHEVVLIDNDPLALRRAPDKMLREFRMAKMKLPSLKERTADKIMEAICFSGDLAMAGNAAMIVENIREDWEMKRSLYQELSPLLGPDILVAINTSCIPITQAAACFDQPDRVVGLHFMNPVLLKDTVEVIKGVYTSAGTLETLKAFLGRINKKGIVVNDSPGFVANRLSHLFMNEAAFLLQEQVAAAKDIDLLFTKGYGHAMGPLATADLIGLDTVVNSLEILYNSFQDPKFRCCPLLKRMVQAGLLGIKSGQGFFKYE